jgi:hypothetical protein
MPLVRPLASGRSYRDGDRVFVVYPQAIAIGTLRRSRERYNRHELYFHEDAARPGVMALPFNERGECTYSTHAHLRLARMGDARVAARYAKLAEKAERKALTSQISASAGSASIERLRQVQELLAA